MSLFVNISIKFYANLSKIGSPLQKLLILIVRVSIIQVVLKYLPIIPRYMEDLQSIKELISLGFTYKVSIQTFWFYQLPFSKFKILIKVSYIANYN